MDKVAVPRDSQTTPLQRPGIATGERLHLQVDTTTSTSEVELSSDSKHDSKPGQVTGSPPNAGMTYVNK